MSEVIFGASTGIGLATINYILEHSRKSVLGISRHVIPEDLNNQLGGYYYMNYLHKYN